MPFERNNKIFGRCKSCLNTVSVVSYNVTDDVEIISFCLTVTKPLYVTLELE